MELLLALDFSAAGGALVQEIAGRPWPHGTAVTVLHVVEPSKLRDIPHLVERVTGEAEKLVAHAAAALQASGIGAATLVLSGDPKKVIVDHARHMAADFVVVGPHGGSKLARFLLGGVARTVVRFASCSVEVVRSPLTPRAAGTGMKILLATDGARSSLGAARSVAERPWPAGTEVRILNAVELVVPLFEAPYFDPGAMEPLREEAMERSQQAMAATEKIIADAGLPVSEALSVLLESAKEVILKEASEWGADLIVVGSHGHHGIGDFLLGSVSEAVAMHSECSVEVIRRSE
ncbi:MAG: universal stress protein [Bryobacteraceae bacterium]